MKKWVESISSMVGETLQKGVKTISSTVEQRIADSVADSGLSLTEFNCKLGHLRRNKIKLSHIASDIERQIKKEELRGNKKRKRQVKEWLEMVQEIENDFRTLENGIQEKGFMFRLIPGDPVAKLDSRVEGLIEQSQHFGGLLVDAYETRGEPLLTAELFGETSERILTRIWEFLETDRVRTIGIYGVGGAGKTTLAKHIHNLVLEKTQDRVYWVRMSKESSIKKLQDDLARVIGLSLSHENDEEKRAAELNRALTQRAGFLLILDDVWGDIDLEMVGDPLCVDGGRLIITTRSLKVCRRIGCQENVEVKTLDEDEAWNLFKQILGEEATFAPQQEEIAKSMVKKYGGLPQGIISLARRMRGVGEIREWRNALAELEEEPEELHGRRKLQKNQ